MSSDTTITIDREIGERLREIADRDGYKVKSLAERALQRGLDAIEAEKPIQARPRQRKGARS